LVVIVLFIINIIGFDFVWFGLVFWGNIFIPVALVLLGLHFYFVSKSKVKEFYLVCVVALIGILVDSTLQYFEIFIFSMENSIPFWLVTLWFCFAATICHSLNFLQKSKILQLLVGAFLAPISYLAGHKLDVVSFGLSTSNTIIILSIIWGVLMLIFFSLKSYLIHDEVNYA